MIFKLHDLSLSMDDLMGGRTSSKVDTLPILIVIGFVYIALVCHVTK